MAGGGRIRGQAEALIRLVGEDQVSELIEKVQKNVKNIEKPALDVRAAFTQVGVAAAGITAAVVAMGKAMEDSARRGGIGRAFSGSFGTPQAALAAIKGVTEAFDDASIQAFATKAARLGIELENIKRLLDLSARAAQATGLEVQDVADEILEGIAGRSSGFFEDRLGLAVDFGRTVSEANKEMQKFGRELSTTEEVALIAGTAIRSLEGSFGDFEDTNAKALQTFDAWIENVKHEGTDALADFGVTMLRLSGIVETSADKLADTEEEVKRLAESVQDAIDLGVAPAANALDEMARILDDQTTPAAMMLNSVLEQQPAILDAVEQHLADTADEYDDWASSVRDVVNAHNELITSLVVTAATSPAGRSVLELIADIQKAVDTALPAARAALKNYKPPPRTRGRGSKKEDPMAGFGRDSALGDAFAFAELNEFGAGADLSMPGDEGPMPFRSAEEMERMVEAMSTARDTMRELSMEFSNSLDPLDQVGHAVGKLTEIFQQMGAAQAGGMKLFASLAPQVISAGAGIAASFIKDEKLKAGVLAGIELGRGLAAVFWNPPAAAAHFAAAAQFGLVAGGAFPGGGGGSRGGGGGRSRAPSVGASSRVSDTGGGTVERHVVINMRGALVTQEGARELDKMIQKEKPSREFVAG